MTKNTQEDAAWQKGFAAGRFDVLRALPTREQIAEASFRADIGEDWSMAFGDERGRYRNMADAVGRLLQKAAADD